MLRLSAFAFSLMFWITLAVIVMAQETKPLEQAPPKDATETVELKELRKLQNEVLKAKDNDRLIERDRLFKILKSAESEAGGRFVADAIWRNWMASAPTEEVADLITKAMEARRWYNYEGARELLNKAVDLAPEYSEAWNQRAYILFLQEKFDASLEDLEKAIALEPRHFGALSGKARILFHQGNHDLARDALMVAVDIHPWIYERFLLAQIPAPGQEPVENKVGQDL